MPFFESVSQPLARGGVITKIPPPSELSRLTGVVTQPDVFFHVTRLEGGYEPLRNDVVSFDMDTDPKSGRAVAIDVKRAD